MKRAFVLLFVASVAHAQAQKVDAKALMQTGVRLLEAKDYLGALAAFESGYRDFPSAKFLINIGTTLKLLNRNAEAANAYQHYLDAPDTDPARRSEVLATLAELDKGLAKISITVTPADAGVQVGDDEWQPADKVKLVRANGGVITVRARRDDYQPQEKQIEVAAGTLGGATISLVEVPKQTTTTQTTGMPDLHQRVEPTLPLQAEGPRARVGAFAMAHVSVLPKVGSAWLVGATADATEQLAIDAALMLGPGLVSSGMTDYPAPPPKYGVYAGASFAFSTDQWRPRVSAGLPIFFSDGARFAVRAAGGIEYVASRHLAITAELGLEETLNPENDIRHLALVPALAAAARL